MNKIKTSLVLEGGGLRGAYTAGALTWLIDQGIEFDHAYGISTGAVWLANYLMKSKQNLYDYSVEGITDKRIIGLKPLLRCGRIVDYDFLFDRIMVEERGFDIAPLKKCRTKAYVGLYDLGIGKTEYHPIQEMSLKQLEASTSLPIIGKIIKENGKELLDGGITDMIPIVQSVEDGCNRNLIITTKPGDFKRKPAKAAIVQLMKMTYPQCLNISEDYRIRHLNYQKQISLIKDLVDKKEAVYVFPSRSSKVTRLGGSKEELDELFELGKSDMEARKEEIFALLKKK
ncbi:MAG: patatin family protein [Erysipelotrichaceae bacterium]|nr:patatin family protein [Erysipelotrichaceae bacterium]MBR2533802.1 patatin family protein [Erysipelotrichaceae bacterium]